MAIGMAISVLVEALLPGGTGSASVEGGEPPPCTFHYALTLGKLL